MNESTFNPYTVHAIRVPLAMVPYPGISAGAKLLYGRLALYRGRKPDGFCNPGLESLAADMGVSTDTIGRWLAELIGGKFIARQHRGRLRTGCIFLPHPCLSSSAILRNQDVAPVPQPCGVENVAPVPQPCGVEEGVQFRNSAASVPQICGFSSANLPANRPQITEPKVGYGVENHHQNVHKNVHAKSASVEGSTAGATRQQNRKPKTSKSLRSDDDENPKTAKSETYARPEDELRAIIRQKTGDELSPDVERRVWESVEIRGVPRKQFMDELRKHVPNAWKNPAGFLTNFARKISSVSVATMKAPAPKSDEPAEPPKNENGRCSGCNGSGYVNADLAARVYCDCRLGRDLKRMDALPLAGAVASEAA
jgi:hypothetical protein